MLTSAETLHDLLDRLRSYCTLVLPGETPLDLRITFASGRKLQHPIPLASNAPSETAPSRKPPYHASIDFRSDFRSVCWFGENYSFTGMQAACVKVLWVAFEDGNDEVGLATILEEAGSTCDRLAPLFLGHPAWNVMIVKGASKGTYRLQPLA